MKARLLFPVLACFVAGCATTEKPIRLSEECFPGVIEWVKEPRACKIAVMDVTDARPVGEVTELNHRELRYLVPLLLINLWSGAGPVYLDLDLYADQSIKQGVEGLLQRVVDQSGVFSGQGKTYDLSVRINHLYSVSYSKYAYLIGFGGSSIEKYKFFPCGHVELAVTLKDRQTGAVVGETLLTRSFLFNQKHPQLSCAHTAEQGVIAEEENRKGVLTIALRSAMIDLVTKLDQMVAADLPGPEVCAPPDVFRVMRLTDEYDFCEEMAIESATGLILFNRMRPYSGPVVSRPGDWIVSPRDERGLWMAPAQYRKVVGLLSTNFNVGFDGNQDAAFFRGWHPPAQSAASAGGSGVTSAGAGR